MPKYDDRRIHFAKKVRFLATALVVLTLTFASLPTPSNAAPKADPWPLWEANNPESTQTVDHAVWGALLEKYLITDATSGVNLFDYAAVTDADRALLSSYIGMLEHTAVSKLNRDEQKAFWINLYNSLTVKVILDNYPVDSIKEIRSGWFTAGPWELKLLTLEGTPLTLNDIEHRILRPLWRDLRIHFAVNCASIGCPDLAASPYTAANVERLLEQGAKAFINHPRGVSFESGELKLSSIFDWFSSDFGESEREVLQSLIPYAEPELAKKLGNFKGGIDYDYDWALNNK